MTNPYIPTTNRYTENYTDENAAFPNQIATKFLKKFLRNVVKPATQGPFRTLKTFYREGPEDQDDGGPPTWSIHSGDYSYEATLCQFWSGEHDNEMMSELVCTLLNIAPDLIAEVIKLRDRVKKLDAQVAEQKSEVG